MPEQVSVPAADGDASDEVLTARALAGDDAAWDALIRRHDRRVVVSLVAHGLPLERARDVAQETWLRLIRQQRAGRLAELRLPGLAVAQASFLARDAGRAARDVVELFPDAPEPGPGFEERAIQADQLAHARRVLAGCSRSAQAVFRLVYEEPGIAHAEAALRTGLSVQRVRQILCEVRKVLRPILEET